MTLTRSRDCYHPTMTCCDLLSNVACSEMPPELIVRTYDASGEVGRYRHYIRRRCQYTSVPSTTQGTEGSPAERIYDYPV